MDAARSDVAVSRSRGWYWPWLLASGMLGIVGVNVVMFAVAASDANGAVVEADYYRKAVDWDRALAARAASAALGWRPSVTLARYTGGEGRLSVGLTDASGRSLTDATVDATLIHNRDAAHPVRVTLRSGSSGEHAAPVPLRWAGRWELRLVARRGADRFEWVGHVDAADLDVAVVPAPGAR